MMKLLILALFISTAFSGTNLYVGYSGKNNNFGTVQEAVNKAASINPSSENSRVAVQIAAGWN